MRALFAAWVIAATCFGQISAQAVPSGSQAMRVPAGYRRTPGFGVDPFRNVMIPHWGFVITTGATGSNNALNLRDIGAISYIDSEDTLRIGDLIDALSLIPRGQGLLGSGQVEGGAYLGLSLGQRFMLGVSADGRGYGSLELDDNAVALLRDGNGARQDFSLGESHASALVTGDLGAHSVIRVGPLGSPDGVNMAIGFGARYVRPGLLLRARSLLANGGVIRATGDSVSAEVGVEILSSADLDDNGGSGNNAMDDLLDRLRGRNGGAGTVVGDLLVRADWPSAGLAFEGMLLNVGGSVEFGSVSRRADTLSVQATSLDSLRESFDSFDLDVRDSIDVTIQLPRIYRLTASAWANTILQLDIGASGSWGGDVTIPFTVDLVSTWRFVRNLPLRAGLIVGARQGIGYSGGLSIDSRNFLFQVAGQSLGGFFKNATGVGARLDLGFFF
jgi:hypothetical protein